MSLMKVFLSASCISFEYIHDAHLKECYLKNCYCWRCTGTVSHQTIDVAKHADKLRPI